MINWGSIELHTELEVSTLQVDLEELLEPERLTANDFSKLLQCRAVSRSLITMRTYLKDTIMGQRHREKVRSP